MRHRAGRRTLRVFLVLGLIAGPAMALVGLAPAPAAASHASPIQVRSLGAVSAPQDEYVESITVPGVDPAANRLVLVWVLHRRLKDATSQEIVDITHPSIPSAAWRKEFHSTASNAQRFALFWTETSGGDPASGDLTIRFSSRSERTLVIVLEAAGVDLAPGAKPFTNVVSDEAFGNNPTSKTHYLQDFVDPAHNVGLAFQMVGTGTTITPEAGWQLAEHVVSERANLTTAAAYDPPGGTPDLDPTFSWNREASSGGLALELRAAGTPPPFPIQRRHLTEGTRGAVASMTTASIAPAGQHVLVAFVANALTGAQPAAPTLSGPGGLVWNRAGTITFDSDPEKRLTVLTAVADAGAVAGPVTISFPRSHDSTAWVIFELSGADLSQPVRQSATSSRGGASAIDVSFLRGFGADRNATLAAVAFDGSGEPTVQRGFARAVSTAGSLPLSVGDLRLWGEWRSTPAMTPGATLASAASAAIVAVEIKQSGVPQIPAVAGVAPNTGPDSGGTEVVINGSDFTDHGTPTVLFGGTPVTPSAVSPSQLRVTAPARSPGTVDISVRSGTTATENTPDDDFTYVPRVSIGDPLPVSEGTASVTFPVTLSATAPFPVSVDYASADGTARAGADYGRTTGTLTIPAGLISGSITVPLLGDALDEADEDLFVDLSNPQLVAVSDGRGRAVITDDDPAPSVSIDDVAVTEGSSGTTDATFGVTLSQPSGRDVTVAYTTGDGTATAPSDYHSRSGTVTIPAGQTSGRISVAVVGDTVDEPNESFVVDLAPPTNATLADAQGQATIADDDETAATVSISDTSVTEGTGTTSYAWFTLTLSSPSSSTVKVSFATADGTAVAGQDYTARTDSLQLAAGETSKQFRIAVAGDAVDEVDELFVVNLSNPIGATIADGRGEATILDDDTVASSVSISDSSVAEGHSGTTEAVFTVSVSPPSAQEVRVAYATANGTGTAGEDYAAASGTLIVPAGQSSAEIRVPVTGDTRDEPDETFFVNLSSPSGATISDAQGQGTIADDDPPEIRISDARATEGAAGTKTAASFTISLSSASPTDVTVSYTTRDGTALAASDYTGVTTPTQVRIAAGTRSAAIRVVIRGDSADEVDETFFVDLSSPSGATIADGEGLGTIVDDDP